MQRQVSLRRKLTCQVSTKLSSSKPQILLDTVETNERQEDDVSLFDERDTSHGPRFAPDEEQNCRVGGRRTEYSENYDFQSLRNGNVESLARLISL